MLTFGAELEVADWNRRIKIPRELGVIDKNDISICNSDGHGVNPYSEDGFGGEINTVVANSPSELADIIMRIFDTIKPYSINYSCWLHIHVGLNKELSLDELKELLKRVHLANQWIPLTNLTPVKKIDSNVIDSESIEMLIRRNLTRQSRMTDEEYCLAMNSTTKENFWKQFERKRHLINMRSLREHNTVEFRFFYMSNIRDEILNAIEFCRDFIENRPIILKDYPKPMIISKETELSYLKTMQPKREKVKNEIY